MSTAPTKPKPDFSGDSPHAASAATGDFQLKPKPTGVQPVVI
jgi:hypothetical protein